MPSDDNEPTITIGMNPRGTTRSSSTKNLNELQLTPASEETTRRATKFVAALLFFPFLLSSCATDRGRAHVFFISLSFPLQMLRDAR